MTGQLGIAFVTGMLATVNPCGFAMLPVFLAFYVGSGPDAGPARRPLLAGLRAGAAVSAGFAVVFSLTGLLVAAGLRAVVGVLPWAAVGIGAVLIAVGVVLASGRQVSTGRLDLSRLAPTRSTASGTGVRAMVGYGVAYAVASLSCSLALLTAVAAQAAATGSAVGLLGVFGAYAAGSSTVLALLAVTAALARDSLSRSVRRVLPVAGRLGGVALVLAGAYLVTYWAPALLGASPGGPVGDLATGASAAATTLIAGHTPTVIIAAALVIVVGLLTAARRRTTHDASPGRGGDPAPGAAGGQDCCAPSLPAARATGTAADDQGDAR